MPTSEFRPKIWLFQDRIKSCFDTAERKISKNAAIPAKKYGFTKQKHIRGDKTLQIYNFGPNVSIIRLVI